MPVYAGVICTDPTTKEGRPGGCGNRDPLRASALTTASRPSRTDAAPSVATTVISRGTLRSRRTTATSVSAPVPAPMSSARGNTSQYDAPWLMTRTPSTAAAKAPVSPWAKLTMRVARYTNTRPTASRP